MIKIKKKFLPLLYNRSIGVVIILFSSFKLAQDQKPMIPSEN